MKTPQPAPGPMDLYVFGVTQASSLQAPTLPASGEAGGLANCTQDACATAAPNTYMDLGRYCFVWFILAAVLGTAPMLQASSPRVVLTPAPGFTITWDGNNGGFSSPNVGAAPPDNIALASHGTVAFTSSDLGTELGIPFHVALNLNDGLYGNIHSWISGSAPDPYAALRFASTVQISSIAWGRDNGDSVGDSCGGTCTDRAVGTYTLQFTEVASPDNSTPDTDDAATGWATLGTVTYLPGAEDVNFTSYLRHRFDVAAGGNPIAATGLRIKVSIGGIGGGLDIDEIEVNPPADVVPPITNFIEIAPAPGFSIAWDRNEGNFGTPESPAPVPANDASASRGATTFGSTELGPVLGIPFHRFLNVNDGLYGNSHSWIPDFIGGDAAPYVGIRFPRRVLISNIAWSRDNGDVAGDCCGGTLADRALGTYMIQITTTPNPGPSTPEACSPSPEFGWLTIGTVTYKAHDSAFFNSHLRHRFDVLQGSAPIRATGIRIKVPNSNSAIDEIEINANVALENEAIRMASAPGADLTWDGNDGQFNNPNPTAPAPDNPGLASRGAIPFTSSDLGPLLGIPFHVAANLNDGLYGNANSWISANGVGGTTDPSPAAGLRFPGPIIINNIAWGRDNGNVGGDCCGGTLTDRSIDTYTLQYTFFPAPDNTTPDTGDAATGWQDLGTITYVTAAPPFFNPSLRHRFDFAPVEATGIRIKVGNGNTDIDEIEVNTLLSAPPPPAPVHITSAAGYSITWDGNDAHYLDPDPGAAPPANRALASQGSTAFSSSDLGPLLGIPFHVAANINDGFYGNAHSWISANGVGGTSDPDPAVGVNFNGTVGVRNIAWSRDNGDAVEGTFGDRALGTYTVQITTVDSPGSATPETGDAATGWVTLGTVEYLSAQPGEFTPYLRHRFDISAGGQPVPATGVRVKVSNGQMDMDELEVNTAETPPACCNAEPSFTLAATSTTSDRDSGPVSIPGWLLNLSAGPNESGQTLTVIVSNNNPALFSAQPSINAAGTLSYTPAPGAVGEANLTVVVSDNGGTGVCGDDTSAPAVFTIVIRAVNRCPVASNTQVTVAQDASLTFQLPASDADGDALTYAPSSPPAHGAVIVNGNTGQTSYTPNPGYCGPDSFKFQVSDPAGCRSAEATVSINVQCLNQCPVALAQAEPHCPLGPDLTSILVLSVNTSNAVVLLDGSLSSDADGDALTYVWLTKVSGVLVPIGAGAQLAVTLDVGLHELALAVDDGRCQTVDEINVEVITVCEAIETLISLLDESNLDSKNKRPLIASLKSACAAFDRGNCQTGRNQLQAFMNKVKAQVAPKYPAEAAAILAMANAIRNCAECSGE